MTIYAFVWGGCDPAHAGPRRMVGAPIRQGTVPNT